MKFLLLELIDKAYIDLGWVDYYTIDKITKDALFLTVFTKIKISKEDSEFDTLVIRNSELGELIGKEVVWNYKSSSSSPLKIFIRNLIKNRKERLLSKQVL